MFQTEINHFLQSFESPALTYFMRGITALGYMEFFLVFIIVLLFAIHFKKGFILLLILMWTAAITYYLKISFALPRPFHVDNTIELLDGQIPDVNNFQFVKRGAISFFSPLPEEVVKATRAAKDLENGFPSGHSSIAIVFWGVLMGLFPKKWIKIICISLMILVPFSRLYLGVHFLADVLGGVLLGAIIWWGVHRAFLNHERFHIFMTQQRFPINMNYLSILLLICPFFLFWLLPLKVYLLPGFMLGFGVGFLWIAQKGIPNSEGTWLQRIGRTILAFLIFGLTAFLIEQLAARVSITEYYAKLISAFFSASLMVWLTIALSKRIGWYGSSSKVV